ncbi:MAG: hypothetical protein AABY22_16500 [Nanoarchaeota archaeon]
MIKKSLEKIIKPVNIEFDEVNHTYINPHSNEMYTGCTTISGAWKKDFLAPWYAKEMYLALEDKFEFIKKLKEEKKYTELLMEAKFSAPKKGKKAMEDGKLAHEYFQKFVEIKIIGKGNKIILPQSPEACKAIVAFIKWQQERNPEWLASELLVASDEHRIAGTLDGLANIDGIPTLIDFKTSSQIGSDALLQCAGYDIMLSSMGFQVRQYLVLRTPKDGKPAEEVVIDNLQEIKFLKETFMHQREAHKFYVYTENKLKERLKIKSR